MKDWWKVIEARAMTDGQPAQPRAGVLGTVAAAAGQLHPRRPTAGTAANWYARDLKIRRGMMASGSGNLATMGPAVPYAVAAKFCFPDRVAIALTGDGAMQMNGLNALHHRRQILEGMEPTRGGSRWC